MKLFVESTYDLIDAWSFWSLELGLYIVITLYYARVLTVV